MAALLARALEAQPGDSAMAFVRVTIELLRPVPLRPLRVGTSLTRPGRRVQLVTATVHEGDALLASATGLRVRTTEVAVPVADVPPPPGPEAGEEPAFDERWKSGYLTKAVDVRVLRGSFVAPGPGTAWIRLRHPIVPGEEPSALSRVAAAADFGNGISNELSFRSHLYINPDLTVYLHRPPVDEWVCLDAVTFLDRRGLGVAESAIFDRAGRIGRSVQGLLVGERQ